MWLEQKNKLRLKVKYEVPNVCRSSDDTYVKISACSETLPWRGARLVKNGDYALVLLFDINGYIAGIQTMVPKGLTTSFPSKEFQDLLVEDNKSLFLTAYFVEPIKICRKGRTITLLENEGTGTNLYYQKGNDPSKAILIPRNETGLAGSKWVKGKCATGMGQHYWFNLNEDTDCLRFFPMFIMYHGGHLSAFGWVLPVDMTSKLFEHPKAKDFEKYMKVVPKCLHSVKAMSTMHVYLSTWSITKIC
ncbi:hypothetical protein Btru_037347 [Bulinus truncatus]|nr:hypothetical protein Btru_037347 [Bulinus truncatus]